MLKTRLRIVLLAVALSVLWAALSLAGPFLLATLSDHRPNEGGRFILSQYTGIFHLQKAPQTLAAPWFAEGLLFAAVGSLATILLVMLLDRQGHSTRALRWSLRTIPCLIAWTCGAAIVAGLLDWLGPNDGISNNVIATLAFGYVLTLPFIFLRSDVIARDRPPLFWLPGWPGLPAVVLSIVAFVAWYGAAILLDDIVSLAAPKALLWWLELPLGLAIWVFGLMLAAYVMPAWRHRWRWSQLASGFDWPTLLARTRALVALDLQLIWISVWLFVPVMLWVAAAIDFTASYLEQVQRLHPTNPPFYLPALVNASKFAVSYWWITFLLTYVPVYCWMLLAPRARAIHLVELTEDPAR